MLAVFIELVTTEISLSLSLSLSLSFQVERKRAGPATAAPPSWPAPPAAAPLSFPDGKYEPSGAAGGAEPEPRMLGMLGIAIGMLGNHRRVQWKAIVGQIRQVGSKLEDSMASRFSDFANGRLGIRSRMPDIDQR